MTRYRILTNGEVYRVQWRPWWWPFWFGVKTSDISGCLYNYEWHSELAAQGWIDNEVAKENRRKKEWRVVE